MAAAGRGAGPASAEGRARAGVVWTLLRYELLMLVRDTRTILIAVVAPLLLFPAILLVMRAVERSEERRLETLTYHYAVTGEEADAARGLVARAVALDVERPDTARPPLALVERRTAPRPDSLLQAGELHLVVEGWPAGADTASDGADVPVVRLRYRGDRDASRSAMERLRARLDELRSMRRDSVYRAAGFPVDPGDVATLEAESVATATEEGAALLGVILTPLLLFLMLSGGSIVAADAIAGEKERGTLETLLTTAAHRREIVVAKLLAVVAVGLAVAVVNVLDLLLFVVVGLLELPAGLAVDLSAGGLVVLLLLFVPLALLVAGVLLLLSGWAKSYKEYQIYFFPVFWVFLVPALAAAVPGMDLRSAVAFAPLAGVAVAVREVMTGDFDWPFLAIAFLSTGAAAWGSVVAASRTLSTERLISAADLDEADLRGGAALFPRQVPVWFGGMWVTLFLTSLWFGEALGLRGQVALNLLGIFLGGSALLLWRYRLPVREALAWRAPHPAVWPAVLVGAPAALVTGLGVSQLAQYVFPVPERLLESFGQYLSPESMPLWQMLLFLAVLPGVCEEIAFRGVLVHGLKGRLRPVPLALVAGLVFGLFHVSLFRILPTAYLGVLLVTVVLITGSLWPAMLWHALNNAAALVPSRLGWVEAEQELAWWVYAAAVAALAAAFAVLWRVRTPLPGVKGWTKARPGPAP